MSFRKKFKVEGGQGGKRGHSGMCHYEHTEIIKAEARKLRRARNKVCPGCGEYAEYCCCEVCDCGEVHIVP